MVSKKLFIKSLLKILNPRLTHSLQGFVKSTAQRKEAPAANKLAYPMRMVIYL